MLWASWCWLDSAYSWGLPALCNCSFVFIIPPINAGFICSAKINRQSETQGPQLWPWVLRILNLTLECERSARGPAMTVIS